MDKITTEQALKQGNIKNDVSDVFDENNEEI